MGVYWTLQNEEAWEVFKGQGYLEGNPEYAGYLIKEYQWMISQMKKRLPNYHGEFPIWLWPKKPDMRSTGHFDSQTRCVRITIELDDEDVLISDFMEWHIVLSDGFNANNEQEYDDYYAGKLSITKEESWERIFDLHIPQNPEWSGTRDWLQGVTGRIYLSNIKKVEHFISRKQGKY
ncbi:DUF3841 domain-containing protein [Paenibacillus sp. NPDC056579]|uniref:DUF3841 domain-containing protein n=1 Tax=Paenibacillus sp. NPDC056579 TaxID=3345871 RepID=UPI0036BC481D